jgi:hypothetical protein
MFDAEEIQALVLGARMVRSWSDARLAEAAKSALAKVEHVLPPKLANRAAKNRLFAPDFHVPKASLAVMSSIRGALEDQRVMRVEYGDIHEAVTERCVRPLALSFWGRSWTLSAWCELREDFRTFRIDRIRAAEVLARKFKEEPGRSLEDFFARMQEEHGSKAGSASGSSARSPSCSSSGSASNSSSAKPPHLDLSDGERRALSRARVRTCEVGSMSGEELFRRTDGAIAPERADEIAALAAFQRLGSVGLECARDFVQLGMRRPEELKGRDPIELYDRLCKLTSSRQDPCVEDVLRCAIAQVEHPDLSEHWRAWHRWTPVRGKPRGTLPDELRRAT